MFTPQQPTFWLKVRKEYVIDNYDTLLPYLRGYHYAQDESPESDFNKTYDCLKEVVGDISQSMADDNVYNYTAPQWSDEDLKKHVGLMAAYLLAAQKKGLSDDRILLTLCNILLEMEEKPDVAMLEDMRQVAVSCAAGYDVVVYGFSWDDINNLPTYALSLFCQKIVKTRFNIPEDRNEHYLEGKGLLVIDNDALVLAPMNKADYDKSEKQVQFDLHCNTRVMVKKLERTNKTEFPELIDTCTDMLRSLGNVAPSLKKELKTYEVGDELIVRVVSNKFGYILCESIDADYVPVRGNLFMPFKIFSLYGAFVITKESIVNTVREGDTLKVRINDKGGYEFIIDSQIFKDFNDLYIENLPNESCDAVYLMPYSGGKGHRWLTDKGVQVNILGALDEETQQAVDNDQAVRIRINESKKDNSGNWVVNGRYVTSEPPTFTGFRNEFLEKARNTFLDEFLEYYYEVPVETAAARPSETFSNPGPLLVNTFYRYSQLVGSSTQRYLFLFAARFLSTVLGDEQSEAFLAQQMRYEECLVHFALGDVTASTLSMRDDDRLPNLPALRNEKGIVEQLCKYQDMNVEKLQLSPGHTIDIDYLSEMVSASNVLRGKLQPAQMNRIKKNIADYIGVADIYRNINRDYTDYGEESDTLEFKTSVVFPPHNNMRADLVKQRWAILKAVCGFLNTVSGGELLLGVNDSGMACGLKNDLNYLFLHRFISSQTMDSYRLYVKTFIDNAFIDDHNVEGLDVTSTVVNYVIEHNNEGDDLLRIQVHPYMDGIVSFRDDYLPDGIARSYYRTSGASVGMDDKLMKLVRERKGLKK